MKTLSLLVEDYQGRAAVRDCQGSWESEYACGVLGLVLIDRMTSGLTDLFIYLFTCLLIKLLLNYLCIKLINILFIY